MSKYYGALASLPTFYLGRAEGALSPVEISPDQTPALPRIGATPAGSERPRTNIHFRNGRPIRSDLTKLPTLIADKNPAVDGDNEGLSEEKEEADGGSNSSTSA